MFRVERTLFLIPRSTRFFSSKGLIKGSSCHSCPTKLFDSKGSSKQINKNRNETVKSALDFDLTLRYANNHSDICMLWCTWYNPFRCIFYFPNPYCQVMVSALIVLNFHQFWGYFFSVSHHGMLQFTWLTIQHTVILQNNIFNNAIHWMPHYCTLKMKISCLWFEVFFLPI